MENKVVYYPDSVRYANIRANAKLLFIELADMALFNDRFEVIITNKELAEKMNMSTRNIVNLLNELADCFLISILKVSPLDSYGLPMYSYRAIRINI